MAGGQANPPATQAGCVPQSGIRIEFFDLIGAGATDWIGWTWLTVLRFRLLFLDLEWQLLLKLRWQREGEVYREHLAGWRNPDVYGDRGFHAFGALAAGDAGVVRVELENNRRLLARIQLP